MILFDAAYEGYISDPSLPRSIYEIPGAKDVALELRSFSKRAGFTGVRCAFMVVPKGVTGVDPAGKRVVAQHAVVAAAHARSSTARRTSCSEVRRRHTRRRDSRRPSAQIDFYMENARLLREGLTAAGFTIFGGVHAPYIWLRTSGGLTLVAVLRSVARDGERRRHAGRGVRTGGRGLLPAVARSIRARMSRKRSRVFARRLADTMES